MLDKTNWTAPANRTLLEPWRKILLDAADLIEQRGHCQDQLEDHAGRLCVLGAIYEATGGLRNRITDGALLAAAMFERSCGGCLPRWNDRPGRQPSEVVAKLREVAAS